MAKRGKNINIFLMDGEVTGKIKCTLSNWTGVIYKVPRIKLGDLKMREDMKQSGIYFLFGQDDETQKEIAYIGQSTTRKNGEGVLFRIQEHTHDSHASYFNNAIILTTQNNSFGPTDISYLENRFTQLAKEADRYLIKNSNEPNPGNVTEEKQSELDEVVDNTLTIIGTLGYRLFVPMVNKREPGESSQDSLYLYLKRRTKKSNQTITATCEQTSEGFVVLKGSQIDLINAPSLPDSLRKKRDELLRLGLIKDGILQEDQLFSSPSYAAVFVLGMAANGRTEWKNDKGITLKELEEGA